MIFVCTSHTHTHRAACFIVFTSVCWFVDTDYLRNFFVSIEVGDEVDRAIEPPLLRALTPLFEPTPTILRRFIGRLLPGRWKRDVCVDNDHFVLNNLSHVTQPYTSCWSVCFDSLWRFSAAVDMNLREHIGQTSSGFISEIYHEIGFVLVIVNLEQ